MHGGKSTWHEQFAKSTGYPYYLNAATGNHDQCHTDEWLTMSPTSDEKDKGAQSTAQGAPSTAQGAHERSHWCQASFVIVGEVMGAGVLGLPCILAQMGWLVGTTAVIFFGLCALYSGYLIAETRNRFHPRAGTFADIAEQLSRKLRGDDDDDEDAVVEAESGGIASAAGEIEAQGEDSSTEKDDRTADEDEAGDEGAMLLASSDGATGKLSSSSTALHISAVAEWCAGEDSAARLCCAKCAQGCCAKCAQVCGCGPGMSLLVGTTRWMMLVNWFMALPFFMMAASNSLSLALGFIPGASSVCSSLWTLAVGVLLLGVSQVRDLHVLSWAALASSIALLVAVVMLLVAMATQGARDPNGIYEATKVLPTGSDPFRVMSSFGGIVWAWGGQATFPEIMREMRDGRKFFPHAVGTANCVMAIVYLLTATLGYQLGGGKVSSFLPHSLADGWAKNVVGALLFFHTFVSYILASQPLTLNIHQMWFPGSFKRFHNEGCCGIVQLHWAIISTMMIALAYLVSNTMPFFIDMMNIAGALTAAPIMLFWTPLLYTMSARRAKEKVGTVNWVICIAFIAVLAPMVTIIGTMSSVANLFVDRGRLRGMWVVSLIKCYTERSVGRS